MTNFTRRAQTPQYGKLPDPLLSQGDFVFALAKPPSPPSPPARPAAGADKEALFWASIEDSGDAAAFEEFLKQFPAGTFAGLARLRLKRLKAARTAALPPPAVEVEDLDATFVALKTANLRAAPSAESARIGRLAKGAALAVTGKVRGRPWYRVAHAGGTAYVHVALVAAVDAAEVAAWARLKDSEKAADFEAFLRHFPRGHFAGRARRPGRGPEAAGGGGDAAETRGRGVYEAARRDVDGTIDGDGVRLGAEGLFPHGQHVWGRRREAGARGLRQGVLDGEIRGDPGRVAHGDGEQPIVLQEGRPLSGGTGLVE